MQPHGRGAPGRRPPRASEPSAWRVADRGQDTIEWVVLTLLLALASAAVVLVLGDNVRSGYTDVEECISMAAGEGRGPPPERPAGGRGLPECRL